MLARNIKEVRRRNGLTQRQLGEKIGVKHSTIAGYESGNSNPDAKKLHQIAEELGVSMEELLGKLAFPDGEIDARTEEEKSMDKALEIIGKQQDTISLQTNTISEQQKTISKLVEIVGRER